MITVTISAVIPADRNRVWSALTEPGQLIRWDERLLELLDPADTSASVGRRLRWRYRLGTVPVELREELLEVAKLERLRSELSFGLFRANAAYSLAASENPQQTRVSLKLAVTNSVPIVGGEIDRFEMRRIASSFVDTKLRHLGEWFDARNEEAAVSFSTDDLARPTPPAPSSPA